MYEDPKSFPILFLKSRKESMKFWSRFGNPSLVEKSVLDVGCGIGALCIDSALSGAKNVVGIDLDKKKIQYATENLHKNFPQISDRVKFVNTSINEYPNHKFDIITSKDSFEHFLNPKDILVNMKSRLNHNGRIYAGFGPLFLSPYGGHDRVHLHTYKIPWIQAFLPEHLVIKLINRHQIFKVSSYHDLELNCLIAEDFKNIIKDSKLNIVTFKTNHSERKISRLFSALCKIPGLSNYFTHNIYFTLTL